MGLPDYKLFYIDPNSDFPIFLCIQFGRSSVYLNRGQNALTEKTLEQTAVMNTALESLEPDNLEPLTALDAAPQKLIEMSSTVWRADQASFEAIVRQHTSMIYSIAFHFLRDGALAEDITQEAFLRLSRNLKDIKSETHLALWLRRVAARLCIDEQRKSTKRFAPLESIPEPTSEQSNEDFLADERIRAMITELPEQTRIALILRFQEDLSPPEIADILQEPVNTVKSRLQRALAALRKKLSPDNKREEKSHDQIT